MPHAGTIGGRTRPARNVAHLHCVWCDRELSEKGGRTMNQKTDALCIDCSRDPLLRKNTVTAKTLADAEARKKEETDGSR